jgi:hypothetical protein
MTEPLEQEDAVRWMSGLGQTGTTVHRGNMSASAPRSGQVVFPSNKNRTSRVQTGGKDGPALMAASPLGHSRPTWDSYALLL